MASSSSEDESSKSSAAGPAASSTEDETSKSGKPDSVGTSRQSQQEAKRSLLGKFWSGFSILGFLFHTSSNEDFEKRLQHLSKEEAAAHTRLKRRSQTWRRLARGLIIYSVVLELLLLGIAVIMTRAPELSWQTRALRVLPVFAFPALASLVYSSCSSYYRMRERKDQKLLDRLRNERKAKIDELKERTNYYLTQQLIHKYDSDPAAKEAAARVLASKLGADAGLALALEQSNIIEESRRGSFEGRRQSADPLDATGLRRRTKHQPSPSTGQSFLPPGSAVNESGLRRGDSGEQIMELEQTTGRMNGSGGGGGWLARLAAMLVGEDPTQCYALICKTCHMHNGLARKEDFQYIAYYCPHCQSLNGSRQLGESAVGGNTPLATTPRAGDSQAIQNNDFLRGSDTEIVASQTVLSESFVTASEQSNGINS
ncbi:hypothetical protein GOP47_0013024 [Adiantum capillus-veneris]|uniref:Lunapark zinc ribbon domain-containing protein n=1 Tax=Adiantum capillus-veneris TaxID=13818 RepID=A0A9D4UT64_ADICA|nr:hypothetical protein GOP47_0012585 [Adiantum capillus-veneris]KAI5072918.1 hypothetical protein GOP47_0013024 [Adiantum capillus-veneris]